MRVGILCLGLVGALVAGSCQRREPPTWDAGGFTSEPAARAGETARALVDASAVADSEAETRPKLGEDASALPQTHDKPESHSADFDARVASLFRAIVDDAPEEAMPFFFPLAAYEQVKDVGNPARDWKLRLVAAYARDIHDLHLRLGANASRARLVRMDVPEGRARWVEPGEEYNKIGYYRVFGSKLRYDLDNHRNEIAVKSLISWRGVWFVVHLGAIK